MNTVNTKEYWDYRFNNDWEERNGKAQTRYFAELAISLFPEWFVREVQKNKHSFCDIGCAQGDALEAFVKVFSESALHGEDFSDVAIEKARKNYPSFSFETADILNKSHSKKYDIVYCSNMLEHFSNPRRILSRLIERSGIYTIVMIPFRENCELCEHVVVFDTGDFPLSLKGSQMVFAQSVMCTSPYYYQQEQLLLMYSKDPSTQQASNLKNIVENIHNKAWKHINDELYCVNTEMESLKSEQLSLRDNVLRLNDEKSDLKDKIRHLSSEKSALENELQHQIDENIVLQDETQRLNDGLRCVDAERERVNGELARLNEEIVRLNAENSVLQGDISCLSAEKYIWESEEKRLNTIVATNADAIDRLQTQVLQSRELYGDIEESKAIISKLQSANTYKWSLYIRRIKDQLIKGKWAEKKDFIKYTLSKLGLYSKSCKDLSRFDLLKDVKALLEQCLTVALPERILPDVRAPLSGLKNAGQVFIFAGIPYYDIGAGQRCSQLAKTFSQMGYRIYYYYAFDSSESIKFDVFIPALVHKSIDTASIEEILNIVESDAVFIFEAPSMKFLPYLDKAHELGVRTIYEHIDNWETSLGSLLYDPQSFRLFLNKSTYLVATSVELIRQLQTYTDKTVVYAPNAVDINLFEPSYKREQPSDLVIGEQKTLLYFGSLWGEWFDWDLIRTTALACPDSVFNMIGDRSAIAHIIETLPENVVFLGLKKQSDLPAYLAYADIAMLPFKNSDIGKYVSPLKIFEYVAMNKKVLATPLPDIIGYPNTVCSDDPDVWIEGINGDISTVDAAAFTSDNSWYNRCNTLLDTCGLGFSYPTSKISVIVLNHNNMSVIFRCADSLLKHGARYGYEIIIVDNLSTDGSREKLAETYGDTIKLIKNDRNGCASGRNLGVENASGDILVFLDSDQWVTGDRWLDCAFHLIHKYPGIGAISWAAGWFDSGKVVGGIVDYFPNRAMRADQYFRDDVAYLGSGGLVMKKSVFDRTDGFDVAYDPTCFEDTDISFQVNHLGLKTVYCPLMGISHLPHQTTKSGNSKHEKLIQKNADYFIEKWNEKNPGLLRKAWGYAPW